MGNSQTPTPTELLNKIKKAEDFQRQDGWYINAQRMLSYLQGDWGQAMYHTKYVVNTIYNLVNLIIPNLYFQNPFLRVKPTRQFYLHKDGLRIPGYQRALLIESVLNQEIKNMGLKEEVRKCIQDVLLVGFGVIKTGISGASCHEDNNEYLQDGDIFAQRVSPFDYLCDPMSTGPKDARFEVYRYTETLQKVKENKMFKNTSDLEGMSLSDFSLKKQKKEDSKDEDKWVELFEYHDHERKKLYILTKDNGSKKRMLYSDDKPYDMRGSDFVVLKFTADNDDWRGIPPLRMIEDEALAINEIISLTVNHLQKFAGIILHEEGALDADDIDRFENGVQGDLLQVQNGALREGRVRRESPMTMGLDYYNNFNLFTNSIDRTLAIPDFQRSAVSGKRKTAFEVNVSASDANNRRGYFVSFVKDFVILVASKITSLMQQFYDEKRWIQMYGDYADWIEWNKEDIQGEYMFDFDIEDIKAYSSSKAQAIITALQVMTPIPLFAPVWQQTDPLKLANQVFKNLDLNFESIKKGTEMAHYEHDPFKETKLTLAGKHIVDPHPGEPHSEHKEIHKQGVAEAQADKNEGAITELTRHIQMHDYWETVTGVMPGTMAGPVANPVIPSEAEAQGGFTYNEELKERL